VALERWRISEDGFEGLMLLIASVFVITMIVWMNRVARHLKKEIEQKWSFMPSAPGVRRLGRLPFRFPDGLREGAELALILRAVELSSEGLQTWIGTIVGIAAAVAVGLFFFKGTLRIPLPPFLCSDERHLDARGVSAGAYGFA